MVVSMIFAIVFETISVLDYQNYLERRAYIKNSPVKNKAFKIIGKIGMDFLIYTFKYVVLFVSLYLELNTIIDYFFYGEARRCSFSYNSKLQIGLFLICIIIYWLETYIVSLSVNESQRHHLNIRWCAIAILGGIIALFFIKQGSEKVIICYVILFWILNEITWKVVVISVENSTPYLRKYMKKFISNMRIR